MLQSKITQLILRLKYDILLITVRFYTNSAVNFIASPYFRAQLISVLLYNDFSTLVSKNRITATNNRK